MALLQDSKFLVADKMRAMDKDALHSSHPLIVRRSSHKEIVEATFDVITYSKVIIYHPRAYQLLT